jgi:1-acyl-sn-glycerol-3-phosphate acyltransferase
MHHRPLYAPLHWLYGAYVLGALGLLMTLAAVLALVVPNLAWRRTITHHLARTWLWLAGIRVSVRGLDGLPAGSCVVVANHSSYLDGVLMKAVLPPRFSFVVKREAASMPVLGVLLRRIGAEFVDRNSQRGRQRDGKRVVRRAGQGHPLVFFPEGTFDEKSGLKRFHSGAFVAAAHAGAPVIPTVINGARRVLPSHARVPRPGPVTIIILPALNIEDCGKSAEGLRDETRRRMLALLDEPDLAPLQTARAQSL